MVIGNWLKSMLLTDGFHDADVLWRGMTTNIVNWVNQNGGSATKPPNPDFQARPDYVIIQDYLRHGITKQQLKALMGC